MKRTWKWWLGAAILFAILTAILFYLVGRFEPTLTEAVQYAKSDSQKGAVDVLSSERVAYYTKVLAIVTGGLAFFGVVQLFFLVRADEAAARSAQIAEEAVIAAHRAYIIAEGFKPFFEPVGRLKVLHWRFRPNWRNTGDIPANCVHYTRCELRTSVLPDGYDFAYSNSEVGNGLINPKGSGFGGLAPRYPGQGVTDADIADVQAGKKFIYLWGWAKYRDGFPNTPRRITHFCYVLNPLGDPKNKDGSHLRWDWVQHMEGNYTGNDV